jgi:hypothetical protein
VEDGAKKMDKSNSHLKLLLICCCTLTLTSLYANADSYEAAKSSSQTNNDSQPIVNTNTSNNSLDTSGYKSPTTSPNSGKTPTPSNLIPLLTTPSTINRNKQQNDQNSLLLNINSKQTNNKSKYFNDPGN